MDNESSSFAIEVLDWNRFASNKSLGKVEINLETLTMGTTHDEWRKLDTKGEVHLLIHVSPAKLSPAELVIRVPRARIQLERTVYYPGQTIRGCLVFSNVKPNKVHTIRVLVEGWNVVWFSSKQSKEHQWNHHGARMLVSCTAALAGSPTEKGDAFNLNAGLHLYPFEFVLPLNIPYSTDPNTQFGPPAFSLNFIAYRITGFVDVANKSNGIAHQHFRVLAHPNHSMMDPGPVLPFPINESADVSVNVQGDAVAWIGEWYTVSLKIDNHSNKTIDSVAVLLESKRAHSAKLGFVGKFTRAEGPWKLAGKWIFKELAGCPLAPGQSWSGSVKVNISPTGLDPTLVASVSPLIQLCYSVGVELTTSDGSNIQVSGTPRYMVHLSDHYKEFAPLTPPADAEGPTGKLMTAPASPDLANKLVPATCVNTPLVIGAGSHFDPISTNPQAVCPPQVISPSPFLVPLSPQFLLPQEDWQAGMVPSWISNPAHDPSKPPFEAIALDYTGSTAGLSTGF